MVTGSCFCSKVSYSVDGPLQNARSCHCSRCRKAFSGASSAYAQLGPSTSVSWSGKEHLSVSAEQGLGIGFCGSCGSTLCGMWDGEVHGLTLGCIDGDPGVEIAEHIFVGSKAPWDHIGGSAPQYQEHSSSTTL